MSARSLLLVALVLSLALLASAASLHRQKSAPAAPLRSSNPFQQYHGGKPVDGLGVRPSKPLLSNNGNYSPGQAYHEGPARPPRPIYQCHWDVEDFHANGAYDAEMDSVIENTMLYAQSLQPQPNHTWIFDVDETSLSGYEMMKAIGFGYVAKLSHEWIMEAKEPAIPQTLKLYKLLRQLGFRVVFLTGRQADEHAATVKNLEEQGFVGFDGLITRQAEDVHLSASDFKIKRRTELVQKGYYIVGCVGDQWSDLRGPYTGFKVKLPNYIYYLP